MNIIKNKKRVKGDGESRTPKINIVDIAVILVFVFLVLVAIEYFTSVSIFDKNEPEKLIQLSAVQEQLALAKRLSVEYISLFIRTYVHAKHVKLSVLE